MPVPLWRNRDFLLLWTGQVVSTLGTRISGLAYPLLVLADAERIRQAQEAQRIAQEAAEADRQAREIAERQRREMEQAARDHANRIGWSGQGR